MDSIQPEYPKVLLVIYDFWGARPGEKSFRQHIGWASPQDLAEKFIQDVKEASHDFCRYQIVDVIEVDGYPLKIDGFRYTRDDYSKAWRSRRGFHKPDWANYDEIVRKLDLDHLVQSKAIDEVWLFAGPYAGFHESRMVGPGAFWCNSPPLEGHDSAARKYVVMGFNYERGVGEMLESYGHRAESILNQVFRNRRGEENLWERYTRHEQSHPGLAEVGTIHFAPNSRWDYDWGNRELVLSRCDNWLAYPDLSGPPRLVNCDEWGNGDIRRHHLWWFRHLPHAPGSSSGTANSWWKYVVNPNLVNRPL